MDLMDKAAAPVLRDVQMVIEGTTTCEIYPYPVPDLFVGSPLVWM